jgi:hypothetical protein
MILYKNPLSMYEKIRMYYCLKFDIQLFKISRSIINIFGKPEKKPVPKKPITKVKKSRSKRNCCTTFNFLCMFYILGTMKNTYMYCNKISLKSIFNILFLPHTEMMN